MNAAWIRDDLTIGEVAEILDIPTKMLRYWDAIGLLKPHSLNEMNGYRYYSSSQFYLLNFTKYLRKLNVPYETIRSRLHETDQRFLVELLKEQVGVTETKIRELGSIREKFQNHIADMEEARKATDLDTVLVQRLPERAIIFQESRIASRVDFELSIGKLEKLISGAPTLLVAQVGLILEKAALLAGEFDMYCGSFIPLGAYDVKEKHIRILPEGEYASIRFWGDIRSSGAYYEVISGYIRDHGYTVCGDLMRKCLAPGIIHEKHAHLAEISIPVQKAPKKRAKK